MSRRQVEDVNLPLFAAGDPLILIEMKEYRVLKTYPIWQKRAVLLLIAVSVLYVALKLFLPGPRLHVSGYNGAQMSKGITTMVEITLEFAKLEGEIVREEEGDVLVYLATTADQLKAKQELEHDLGANYVVTAVSTPQWLQMLGFE